MPSIQMRLTFEDPDASYHRELLELVNHFIFRYFLMFYPLILAATDIIIHLSFVIINGRLLYNGSSYSPLFSLLNGAIFYCF